jgi:hypothetical protein
MCFFQDDLVKFVSEPTSPPRLVEIPDEGKSKAKERREVGGGDDTVVVEDTSDEDDEETLQEWFQLRSRFSRPGLPNIPLVQDPPTSLEAIFPAPPRKPRNVAHKCVAKKLKVPETISQEVSSMSIVVEYLFLDVVYADDEITLLAGDSAFRPRRTRGRRRLGSGGRAGWSQPQPSPHRRRTCGATGAPAPVATGSTESAVAVAEQPTTIEAEGEAPAEAGLVDIASILGAPIVTVVWSSL